MYSNLLVLRLVCAVYRLSLFELVCCNCLRYVCGSTSEQIPMCIIFVPNSDCHVFLLYYCIVGGHMLYYSNTFR